MIGNDVVDLELAELESNWKRKGFLDKIFTKNEQQYILNSENQEIAVWNLWSRKEASYKIWNRETKIRRYNPTRFECFDMYSEIGKVKFETTIFYTKTEILNSCIHSTATTEKSNLENIEILENSIIIEKENGIPFHTNKKKKIIPVSKSHHGRFEKIVSIKFPI